jgi:hypothetical protein
MLSGGGAVTFRGSSRYKRRGLLYGFSTRYKFSYISFRTKDAVSSRIVENVNTKPAFGHEVQPLEVRDMDAAYMIKGEVG